MSYLDCLRRCQRHDLSRFRPLLVGGTAVGWIRHDFAPVLAGWPDVFDVAGEHVALASSLSDFEARSAAVDEVVRALHARGELPDLRGEPFPVLRAWGEEPLLAMDRGAVNRFGVRAFGIHLNGFVRTPDGLAMWIARRSDRVRTEPGKLDHLVAGGQPHGLSLAQNLAKECAEEASIPAELVARAVPTGSVAYRMETEEGLKDDTLFTYDLELPVGFVPVALDGEVAGFRRWPVERVMAAVRDEGASFKFNVPPVLIDFFVRHGLLGSDEPEYAEIVRALRG